MSKNIRILKIFYLTQVQANEKASDKSEKVLRNKVSTKTHFTLFIWTRQIENGGKRIQPRFFRKFEGRIIKQHGFGGGVRGGRNRRGDVNLKEDKALFGRNWGCKFGKQYKNLHFEVCYYQAIDFAIQQGLERVEAGVQGNTKFKGGTYSAHYINDPALRQVILRYLTTERMNINWTMKILEQEASLYKVQSQQNSRLKEHVVKKETIFQKKKTLMQQNLSYDVFLNFNLTKTLDFEKKNKSFSRTRVLSEKKFEAQSLKPWS
eukprot:TRINITY_DN4450_c1_g1_i1.p4 TRINITY_DN4450_c1_g1~~TRINITY_DN4450_c1_g1_i1.p4  ORF type:complete len:263 (+),score=26.12 TRINITY_DN4450_c1_g1_i1:331-1119(+)